MKPTNNAKKRLHRLKGLLEKSFLVSSVILLVFVISQCGDKADDPVPAFPDIEEPELGGSDESFITSVFKSVATGAAGNIGSTAAGWAMGAMGLSASSPDYTSQLDTIHNDLLHISDQLDGIQDQLSSIDGELVNINCTEWENTLKNEKGRIKNLMKTYKDMVASGAAKKTVSQKNISQWVDEVLAEGDYTDVIPMGEVLANIASQVYVSRTSGIIPACIKKISAPEAKTLGSDTSYYKQVKYYTDFYANYQLQGTLMLNEALHYRAWEAAGSPNADALSPDSTSYVCGDPDVAFYCNEASSNVNDLYNNLVQQLTAAGAPYTTDDLVMLYDSPDYIYLLPTSLEDFTTAAGDNCTYPLTSANPCGKTAGYYNSRNFRDVVYKGYTNWYNSGTGILKDLLKDWKSGTAGDYLESLGFKNMSNKVILSGQSVEILLDKADIEQEFVVFFDTDLDYSSFGGLVSKKSQYDLLAENGANGDPCWWNTSNVRVGTLYTYSHNTTTKVYERTNYFYNLQATVGWYKDRGGSSVNCHSLTWTTEPGWLTTNKGSNAIQFRWPAVEAYHLDCTNGRDPKNNGSMWTMCGDDFTQWLDNQLPRPETCDLAEDPSVGIGTKCTKII